jgi:hypothetical protein
VLEIVRRFIVYSKQERLRSAFSMGHTLRKDLPAIAKELRS